MATVPNAPTGSALTIEELGPSGPGLKPRRIVLSGPGLPHMGAEWGFENANVTDWYPGNSVEATQQTMGPRDMPSAWEGTWRRTMMGKAPSRFTDERGGTSSIVNPYVMWDLFEAVGRAGIRLRVTWSVRGQRLSGSRSSGATSDVDVKVVRVGLMRSFKAKVDTEADIGWSVQFDWAGRGGTQARVATVRDNDDARAAAHGLAAAVAAMNNKVVASRVVRSKTAIRKSASGFSLGQLEALANAPLKLVNGVLRTLQQGVSAFKRVVDVVDKVRRLPFAIEGAINDFARNARGVANNAIAQLGRSPRELHTSKPTVASVLRSAKYFGGVEDALALCARRSQELEATIARARATGGNRGELSVRDSATTRAGAVIAIHVCKTGETPQSVSTKHYGSADHGLEILRSNRLPWHTASFARGQILIVPALRNTTARANT